MEAKPKGSISDRATDLKDSVVDALHDGGAGLSDSAETARQNLAQDIERLRSDLASVSGTLSKFISESGGEAARTASKVGEAFAAQMGAAASDAAGAGADMASAASGQVKTFASELEAMARRQPLGSLVGALAVGVIIGMLSRRHS
jgi:ElaB/YqjD/DUF883 family membrane-anchored ribosome-binding protein